MPCWVLVVEQAGYEHISDEYKDRYIIIILLKSAYGANQTIRDHHMVPYEPTKVC